MAVGFFDAGLRRVVIAGSDEGESGNAAGKSAQRAKCRLGRNE
jgi:hypothetical protein